MAIHHRNAILPPFETDGLVLDGQAQLTDINERLQIILDTQEPDTKKLGGTLRAMDVFHQLRYVLDVQQRSSWLHQLQTILLDRTTTTTMQCKVLKALNRLVKKGVPVAFKPDFSRIWARIVALAAEESELPRASANIHSLLLKQLVAFMHSSRHYLDDEAAAEIIAEAEADLEKTNTQDIYRGLCMLHTCLPTANSHYDSHLDLWLEHWLSRTNNTQWDSMWCTIFCRARKYTTTYEWSKIIPLAFTNLRRMLPMTALPNDAKVDEGMGLYGRLRQSAGLWQSGTEQLKKFVKMCVFLIPHGSEIAGASPEPLSLELVGSFVGLMRLDPHVEILVNEQLPSGAHLLLSLLRALRTGFYPSNMNTETLKCFGLLKCICDEILKHCAWACTTVDTEDGQTIRARPTYLAFSQQLNDIFSQELIHYVQEGLYNAHPAGAMASTSALEALAVLSPELISSVMMPFFLRALDPEANTHAHQAPAALSAIATCVQPLLHPNPYLLRYLPQILTLSLPGLDPNDNRKTFSTLMLYSELLSWLPIGAHSYRTTSSNIDDDMGFSTKYVTLSKRWTHPPTRCDDFYADSQEEVGRLMADWSVQCAERLCLVLCAQEDKKNVGKGQGMHQMLSRWLNYFSLKFFQQMDAATHAKASKIMINYICSHSKELWHAVDQVGAFISSIAYAQNSPTVLQELGNTLVSGIVDDEGKCIGNSSTVAFRLHLLGAAVRFTHERTLVVLPILQKIFTDEFFLHDDKDVRKAACACLHKSLLGLTTPYPTEMRFGSPDLPSTYGLPPTNSDLKLTWFQPNSVTLAAAAQLLRCSAVAAIEKIDALLQVEPSANEKMETLSTREVNDTLRSWFRICKWAIIGAAEMLSDSFEVTGDDVFLHTGMSVLARLPEDTRRVFVGFRQRFATFLHSTLAKLLASATFCSDVKLLRSWCTLARTCISTRCDDSLSFSMPSSHTKFSRATKKFIKRTYYKLGYINSNSICTEAMVGLQEPFPWDLQVSSRFLQIAKAMALHRTRKHQLSFTALRGLRSEGHMNPDDPYPLLFMDMHTLCLHDYTLVRTKAQQMFEDVSSRFGFMMSEILHRTLDHLVSDQATFQTMWGVLGILALARVQKRICGSWTLMFKFVNSIVQSHVRISEVCQSENENSDAINNAVISLCTSFVSHWQYLPTSTPEDQIIMHQLLSSLLAQLGSSRSTQEQITSSEDKLNFSRLPYRFELFAAWNLCKIVEHSELTPSLQVWQWCFSVLREAQGQPLEHIALATLARLLVRVVTVSGNVFYTRTTMESVNTDVDDILARIYPTDYLQIRDLLCDEVSIEGLFKTVAYSHVSSGGTGLPAHWSNGVEIMTGSTQCRVGVRTFNLSLQSQISPRFKIRNALLSSWYLCAAGPEAYPKVVQVISRDRIGSEEELEQYNCARAAMFAGLVRAGCSTKILIPLLEDQLKVASMETSKPWADALAACLCRCPTDNGREIVEFITSKAIQVMVASGVNASGGQPNAELLDERTTQQGRYIMFARALVPVIDSPLHTTASTSMISSIWEPLLSHGLRARYQPLREEAGAVINTMLLHGINASERAEELLKSFAQVCEDQSELWLDSSESKGEKISADQSPETYNGDDLRLIMVKSAATLLKHLLSQPTHLPNSDALLATLLRGCALGMAIYASDAALVSECKIATRLLPFTLKSRRLSPHSATQDTISSVLKAALALSTHPSWTVRTTSIGVCGVIQGNIFPALNSEESRLLLLTFTNALADERTELAEQARVCVMQMLCVMTPLELQACVQEHAKVAETFAAARSRKVPTENRSVSPQLLISIQGLCACIRAYPYDLPTFLPSALSTILKHTHGPFPVNTIVAKTVQDFKRTHQDRWNDFKFFFSSSQLEDLRDADTAQHYYV